MHGRDHCPGGADPIPCLPHRPRRRQPRRADPRRLAPSGLWKLNESSGDIAFDSSGNGQDLQATGVEVDPDWAQPAGPPGEQTASFEIGTTGLGGTASRVSRSWASITRYFPPASGLTATPPTPRW